mgnify:FL=1
MSVRRFFVYFRNIQKLQAEESLLKLRIVSHPYMDPQKGNDHFIENLYRAVGAGGDKKAVKQLTSDGDAADWGIKIINREAGEEEDGCRRSQGEDNC